MTAANGDFYIDNLTHDFYLRENDAWHLKGNIGPNGSAGVGPPLGSPAPEGLYVDTGTGDIYIDGAFIGTLPGGASVGPPGANGRDGARGFDGDDGSDGDDGPPGKAGRDGIDGAPGADGADGAPGADGADGADGANGIDGARGLFGFPGEDGSDGDDGPPGKAGRDGIDGAPGADGADGADGANGIDGARGLFGFPGEDGEDGEPAPVIPGKDGRNGIDGRNGCDGVDGADGEPGPSGKDGLQGLPGLRGLPGEDASDGDPGPPGLTGPAGLNAGLQFAWNTATSGDPGDGKFLLNSATFASAGSISISRKAQTVSGATKIVGLLLQALLNTGTNCAMIFKNADATKYMFVIATAATLVDNTTYYTISISPQQSDTFTNGEVLYLEMYKYGPNGTNGAGVASGGTNGQFLKKLSGTNFDTGWVDFPARQPILTSTADYYVDTTLGSDTKAGLGTGVFAFKTIQKAINTVATLDIGNFGVNIHVADGTYSENIVATAPWVGAGAVSLIGNVTTPANCIISGGAGDCVQVTDNATLVIQGFKFVNTTGTFHLAAIRGGSIKYGTVEFGAAGAAHIRIQDFGRVTCIGNYTISGSSVAHINNVEGMIRIQGFTITLTGTPNFSTGFVFGNQNGLNLLTDNTYSGAATGPRFNVSIGATISVHGVGLGALPGNTNGVIYGGGQYDGLVCKGLVSKNGSYTTANNDTEVDTIILHPGSDTTARTFTIEANATAPYPLGKVFRFINQNGAGVLTIAINSDTMRLAGAGTTGSRTLAANGVAEATKIDTTEWIISGTGLT